VDKEREMLHVPETHDEIRSALISLLAQHIGRQLDHPIDDKIEIASFGLDSLNLLIFVLHVEANFDIRIPRQYFNTANLYSFGMLCSLVEELSHSRAS